MDGEAYVKRWRNVKSDFKERRRSRIAETNALLREDKVSFDNPSSRALSSELITTKSRRKQGWIVKQERKIDESALDGALGVLTRRIAVAITTM